MVIERGEPWERPATGPAQWEVEGDDATLAAAVREMPGVRVGFRPSPQSDLARAVGGFGTTGGNLELPIDALRVDADGRAAFAVNMAVFGTAPDRTTRWTATRSMTVRVDGRVVFSEAATGVVIANGEYLRGFDVVPRGHPGDGRAEVHVYALRRGERAGMRERLRQGVHLPHPDILVVSGRQIQVIADRNLAVELDGVEAPAASQLAVEVVPEAFSLVI
jgi:hypothetical protein